jgi:hypothetical protein
MTLSMQAVRMVGNILMTVGAWRRRPRLLVIGLLVVLVDWLRGLLFPRRQA